MFDWTATLAPALQERLVLVLNHVIAREPAAMDRLKPFSGQRMAVAVVGGPRWAPALPDLALMITPAGLLERVEPGGEAALRVEIDGSNPLASALAAARGERRGVTVSGDAALAGAVNWLFEHLRFDPADELSRALGPAPAAAVAQVGAGLRAALQQLMTLTAARR